MGRRRNFRKVIQILESRILNSAGTFKEENIRPRPCNARVRAIYLAISFSSQLCNLVNKSVGIDGAMCNLCTKTNRIFMRGKYNICLRDSPFALTKI